MKLVDRMFSTELAPVEKRAPKRVSLLKSLIDYPDDFKLEAWIEEGQINITIRKREVKE